MINIIIRLCWGVGGCTSAGLFQIGIGVGALAGRCCWGNGIVTAFDPGCWCRRGRDPTINMMWKVEGGRGEGGGGSVTKGRGEVVQWVYNVKTIKIILITINLTIMCTTRQR